MVRDTIKFDNLMTSSAVTPPALLWPAAPLPGAIAAGDVHAWAWTIDGRGEPLDNDLRLLDDRERQRTARFIFMKDRVRYSICHANMRRILGSYLHRSPESIEFVDGPGGKPSLVPSTIPLRFNLSHSKTIALLAVASRMEVGVDVENVRPIEAGVAERFFSPAELKRLATLDGEEWLHGFYRCWTRKEAVLKVEGVGLRIPLDSFDVSLLPEEPAALLAARPEAKLTADWRLHHLEPAAEVMGALAVADPSVFIAAYAYVG